MPNSTPGTLPLHLAAVATIEALHLQLQEYPRPRTTSTGRATRRTFGPIPELTIPAELPSCLAESLNNADDHARSQVILEIRVNLRQKGATMKNLILPLMFVYSGAVLAADNPELGLSSHAAADATRRGDVEVGAGQHEAIHPGADR